MKVWYSLDGLQKVHTQGLHQGPNHQKPHAELAHLIRCEAWGTCFCQVGTVYLLGTGVGAIDAPSIGAYSAGHGRGGVWCGGSSGPLDWSIFWRGPGLYLLELYVVDIHFYCDGRARARTPEAKRGS